jgi:hypothetical protein
MMTTKSKQIVAASLITGSIILAILAVSTANKRKSFPYVSRESDPVVRNYFGLPGFLNASHPRGIRNNNPGNLRITTSAWKGKIPVEKNSDGAFEQFISFEYGLRAMIRQLKNDIDRGYNTLTKLIGKYAPASENNTSGYIAFVAGQTGIHKDAGLISTKALLKNLVRAMALMENGPAYPVSDRQFEQAYSML